MGIAAINSRLIKEWLLFGFPVLVGGLVGGVVGSLIVIRTNPQTFLTAALVLITGFYAIQTHRTVTEMKNSRTEAERLRRLEKSQLAAARVLAILYSPLLDDWTSASDLDPKTCRELARQLRNEGPLLLDKELRNRVRAAELVLFTTAFPESEFSPGDRGFAALIAKVLVRAVRSSVEAYLREEELPDWRDLPPPVGAQAWLIDVVRGKRPPPS